MKTKKINKSTFYKNKKLFNIRDIDVNNILVSKKESYGTKNSLKYFIGYNNDEVIRPLCIDCKKGPKQFLLVYVIPQITTKSFYFFFQQSIRMSEKNIKFEDKKNQQKYFL